MSTLIEELEQVIQWAEADEWADDDDEKRQRDEFTNRIRARVVRIREEEAKLVERLAFWGLPRDSSGYAYAFARLAGPIA